MSSRMIKFRERITKSEHKTRQSGILVSTWILVGFCTIHAPWLMSTTRAHLLYFCLHLLRLSGRSYPSELPRFRSCFIFLGSTRVARSSLAVTAASPPRGELYSWCARTSGATEAPVLERPGYYHCGHCFPRRHRRWADAGFFCPRWKMFIACPLGGQEVFRFITMIPVILPRSRNCRYLMQPRLQPSCKKIIQAVGSFVIFFKGLPDFLACLPRTR